MAELQSGEGRTMIDSVVWAQYVNVTNTQTATQPRRDSNSRPNEVRSGDNMNRSVFGHSLHELTW